MPGACSPIRHSLRVCLLSRVKSQESHFIRLKVFCNNCTSEALPSLSLVLYPSFPKESGDPFGTRSLLRRDPLAKSEAEALGKYEGRRKNHEVTCGSKPISHRQLSLAFDPPFV